MKVNDLSIQEICNNFCMSNTDYHLEKCKIGDKGYFGNNAHDVDFNMQNNNVQILEDIECYSSYPFISKGKQYSMFYVLRKKED